MSTSRPAYPARRAAPGTRSGGTSERPLSPMVREIEATGTSGQLVACERFAGMTAKVRPARELASSSSSCDRSAATPSAEGSSEKVSATQSRLGKTRPNPLVTKYRWHSPAIHLSKPGSGVFVSADPQPPARANIGPRRNACAVRRHTARTSAATVAENRWPLHRLRAASQLFHSSCAREKEGKAAVPACVSVEAQPAPGQTDP